MASTGRRHGLDLRSAVRGAGMSRRLTARLAGLGLPPGPTDPRPVTEADLAPLPEPAQRWMRRSGLVGRPRDWSFRVRTTGRFRLCPERGWMPFEAWQYDSGPAVARVYCMRVDMAGVLPVYAVDSYVAGRGRMRGRLLGLVPVADGSGPEFDVGELATWVDDVAMTAPSMLLVPAARWTPVDDGCVQLAFTDSGTTVTTGLSVDAAGRLTDISTEEQVRGPAAGRGPGALEHAGRRLDDGGRARDPGGRRRGLAPARRGVPLCRGPGGHAVPPVGRAPGLTRVPATSEPATTGVPDPGPRSRPAVLGGPGAGCPPP